MHCCQEQTPPSLSEKERFAEFAEHTVKMVLTEAVVEVSVTPFVVVVDQGS